MTLAVTPVLPVMCWPSPLVCGFTPGAFESPLHRLMLRAAHSGLPVARVGRSTWLLLMACKMNFGALPPAANPDQPTAEETGAVCKKVAQYQAVFNTH